MELSPYEKMQLNKAKNKQVRSHPGKRDPDAVREVKRKMMNVPEWRARAVLKENHKDEYLKLKRAESLYIRTLIVALYNEGFTDYDSLLAEAHDRLKNP
jgi:hypothetical protein